MKNTIWITLLFSLALAFSCSEEKGNYDYKVLNSIEIEGFKPSNENGGIYLVVQGTRLLIEPELKQALEKDDDLSYLWLINKDTVARTRNLDMIMDLTFGSKECCYIVIDNKTQIRYYHLFNMTVTSPYSNGYYLLAEQDDKSAVISYLSTAEENPEVINTRKIGDIELGSSPAYANCSYGYSSATGAYQWTMSFITREGDYRMIQTNTVNFMPTASLNDESFLAGNPDHYQFNPTYLHTTLAGSNFFIANGKLVALVKGVLYRPAKGNYDLAPWIGSIAMSSPLLTAFDRQQHKFIHLRQMANNPAAGTVGDANTCDEVVAIQGTDIMTGQEEIIGGGMLGRSMIVKAITRDASNLYFYTVDYADYKNPKLTRDATIAASGINENTRVLLIDNTWYILIGNTIYKTPVLLPALTPVKTIPAEMGEIQTFVPCKEDSQFIIATYDANAKDQALKGSIYFLNAETGEIQPEKYPYCTGKVVSILNVESNPY